MLDAKIGKTAYSRKASKDTARQSRNQKQEFITPRRQDAKIFRFLIQTNNTTKAAECVASAQKIMSKLHAFST
jgi:hypothetical protein